MAKRLRRRIALAQNFFRCPELVQRLVLTSSIDSTDTVVEIGAGEGIITQALSTVAQRVIAIEKDPHLAAHLRRRFGAIPNVEVLEGDFLARRPDLVGYKIFANIPFNLTATIMHALLDEPNPPDEAYLVMQKEAAQKFSGIPQTTLVAILAQPWFEFQIVQTLQRTDFIPVTSVDVVLMRIKKRGPPLLRVEEAEPYRKFVQYGFRGVKSKLRLTYAPIFTYSQWKRLARVLHFDLNSTPTQLTLHQWLGLFNGFIQHVARTKQAIVLDG